MTTKGPALRRRELSIEAHVLAVFEPADLDALLDERAAASALAPYGAVPWPAGLAVAARLLDRSLAARRVLDVGTGCGLAAVAAARAGASVLAVDVDPMSEHLVAAAARAAAREIPWARFDVTSAAPLPPADLVVFADLLYEPVLAGATARRVLEARARGSAVVVGDPGRAGRSAFVSLVRDHGLTPEFVDVPVTLDGRTIMVGVWETT